MSLWKTFVQMFNPLLIIMIMTTREIKVAAWKFVNASLSNEKKTK